MTVTIRRATARDASLIAGFNVAMAQESEDRALDAALLEQGVRHVLLEPGDGFYLVAEVNGQAAGSLLVTYEWSDWRNGRFWWVQSVYVLPEYRRRGVYSRMHARVREAALADGHACGLRLYVEKDNTGAQATYSHIGMQKTGYRLFEEEFDRGTS
ncbi:MAG: GNAT family N-acetyltransferase [Gammaproteobacteria bacterium]|nr:GNAT family N-acetyltransferase [Gammaproteobacteria bacterium]MDE0368278.1 GNAT family N-acetyltransferase [Gammaproteobacteria bacterium]